MTDVARLAGVSHQTVSRVLNNHPSVTSKTRLRVQAAMAELGYRRNQAARALVTGHSKVLGALSLSSTLYGPASLLTSFEQSAANAGYAVIVASIRARDIESIREGIERHLEHGVAGIVVIAPVEQAGAALDAVPVDVPLICIDGDPARRTPLVMVDQAHGGQLATRHLLEAGHKTVWHVSGPQDWFAGIGRLEGWRSTLEEAGVEIPPPISGDWSPESGYRAGQMLARIPEVTAVFAANDHLALGILSALREAGRRVPDDISLVGFDDIPEASFFLPPLTTVRPDFAAVAHKTFLLLSEQIEGASQDLGRHTLAPTLVKRHSTGPPPA
jgi:DNA-binding LacI/PurR family transcriptional regulator